jgi:hypothetical protein
MLTSLVYSAHEARYNATGKFVAFTEGATGLADPTYVYEFVVDGGSTWIVKDTTFAATKISPIIYFKSAVGLLAMFDSAFTEKMASYVESKLPTPTRGYSEGIDENGRVETWAVGNAHSMIIQAAQYAINGNPTTSPTPSPSPTKTPTPIPTSSHNPTPSPSSLPTPTQTTSPTANPTPTSSGSLNNSTEPMEHQTATPSTSNEDASKTQVTAQPQSPTASMPQDSSESSIPSSQSTSDQKNQKIREFFSPFYYLLLAVIMILLLFLHVIILKYSRIFMKKNV